MSLTIYTDTDDEPPYHTRSTMLFTIYRLMTLIFSSPSGISGRPLIKGASHRVGNWLNSLYFA